MKTPSSKSINAFLSGLPGASHILSCYTGVVQVYKYVGPHRFYRAAGYNAASRLGRAYGGEWWVDESALLTIARRLDQFQGWLMEAELKRAWPAQYRALTALCKDWNDMSQMFKLELPGGEELEGLAGRAKEQPEFSSSDPGGRHQPNRVLVGMAEQIFFRVKNPLWIHRIHLW